MTPTHLLWIFAGVSAAIIGVSMLVVLWRAVTTHNDARRAVLADIIYVTVIAGFLVYTLFERSSIVYDVVLIAGLGGAIGTISYARILTRGRR
ncbi:monovalent cation/H+ antiporter complex subunit F [Corynebacterium terpenotabidum]|uniref:Putative monovalent cation/H+ antiporter subunit F n=1 Tax=Corynebacterium terpenotabidum Y-11 TaxID=1200352 RepID=S4XF36_9CORY|nr:monovalent cation/H+ antiporter complex subunit F [Corynebacterium terpenotabidum]AGP31752.1 putative monovalent cation/H+ antiporter subunit F [Corynebacterium terpenotabidum Y-11]